MMLILQSFRATSGFHGILYKCSFFMEDGPFHGIEITNLVSLY